jgi:hypothetical protein
MMISAKLPTHFLTIEHGPKFKKKKKYHKPKNKQERWSLLTCCNETMSGRISSF